MASIMKTLALLALLGGSATITNAQTSGTGATTRYWDCCKGSCGWAGKASVSSPVVSCDISDNPLADMAAKSNCDSSVSNGPAFMCSNQSPWAVNDDLSYGFAAVNIAGGSESSWCCSCYELTFTSGPVSGKKFVVQATNTGGDLGSNQFDLAIPGGGVGIYNGCTNEWGAPANGWGAQYGGISSRSDCDSFPDKLKPGCYWRFDWFQNANNPAVSWKKVTCPTQLTELTGCARNDETPTPGVSGTLSATATAKGASSSVAAAIKLSSAAAKSSSAAVKSSSAAAKSSSAAVKSSSAAAKSSSAAAATASSGGNGLTAAHWAQCGGKSWTGATECVSGTTCMNVNEWYFQCQ